MRTDGGSGHLVWGCLPRYLPGRLPPPPPIGQTPLPQWADTPLHGHPSPLGRHSPRQTSPWAHTSRQTPPTGQTLPRQTYPTEQTSPQADTPRPTTSQTPLHHTTPPLHHTTPPLHHTSPLWTGWYTTVKTLPSPLRGRLKIIKDLQVSVKNCYREKLECCKLFLIQHRKENMCENIIP